MLFKGFITKKNEMRTASTKSDGYAHIEKAAALARHGDPQRRKGPGGSAENTLTGCGDCAGGDFSAAYVRPATTNPNSALHQKTNTPCSNSGFLAALDG